MTDELPVVCNHCGKPTDVTVDPPHPPPRDVIDEIAQMADALDGNLPAAVDYFAVEILDNSQREWSERTGRSHAAAGKNIRNAKENYGWE